jgi:hypothetical protein
LRFKLAKFKGNEFDVAVSHELLDLPSGLFEFITGTASDFDVDTDVVEPSRPFGEATKETIEFFSAVEVFVIVCRALFLLPREGDLEFGETVLEGTADRCGIAGRVMVADADVKIGRGEVDKPATEDTLGSTCGSEDTDEFAVPVESGWIFGDDTWWGDARLVDLGLAVGVLDESKAEFVGVGGLEVDEAGNLFTDVCPTRLPAFLFEDADGAVEGFVVDFLEVDVGWICSGGGTGTRDRSKTTGKPREKTIQNAAVGLRLRCAFHCVCRWMLSRTNKST